MKIKFAISLLVLMLVFSCSKIPFLGKNEDTTKEDLKKKEQELIQKEEEIKNKEQLQIEKDKEQLKQKEEELTKREKELTQQNKIKAITSPKEIPTQLIQDIDRYATKNNEVALKRAYDLWFNPLSSIGSFEKFKAGFTNTLDDKVYSVETISNDGYNSEVEIIHVAKEININSTGSYDMYQRTKYKGKYKLISIDGIWKISSGKASVVSRENY